MQSLKKIHAWAQMQDPLSVVAILGRYFPIMDNQGIGLCCSQPPRRQVFSPRGPNYVF